MAHVLADHRVESLKKLANGSLKALLGQVGGWFVKRRRLKRRVVCLSAITLMGDERLTRLDSEAFLACIYPDREVGHRRQLFEGDFG
jgi:hypothetical protein